MTLFIAIAGVALGLVSLVWQIVTWRSSGPNLTVTCAEAFPVGPDFDRPVPFISVEATNRGRMAAPVASVGWEVRKGQTMVPTEWANWSDPLPTSIAPHDSASWAYPAEVLRGDMERHGIQEVRAFVRTSTGDRLRAKKPITLQYLVETTRSFAE